MSKPMCLWLLWWHGPCVCGSVVARTRQPPKVPTFRPPSSTFPRMPKAESRPFNSARHRRQSTGRELFGRNDKPHTIYFNPLSYSGPAYLEGENETRDLSNLTSAVPSREDVSASRGRDPDSLAAKEPLNEEEPYRDIRDKRFYGKKISFYYYFFTKSEANIDTPPNPTPGVWLTDDVLFAHRDPTANTTATWIWTSSTPDGPRQWSRLKENTKYEFPHGDYYYTVAPNGHPCWVTYETLRKSKYR
ncbi:hypothetical protein DFP72DRAFT_844819 [Ephemerocybe angulata]|uniref:Uncharacterized protein n=1 Tax=Ephemerocybe angulata TaxID=980116 RepID=A0A8H6I708_9AGAR|nr:hypothetical protein DFP72DRAFT_844819 [Tulosesus angulatus]